MPRSEIFLIRHGIRLDFVSPDWKENAEKPFDPPLADIGLQQAEDIAGALKMSGIKAIYSSPYLRAIQTAAASSHALDIEVRIEPGFGEWLNPGFFTDLPCLLSPREAVAICPLIDTAYEPAFVPSSLEPKEEIDVASRVDAVLKTIFHLAPADSFAIFTHGSPLCQAALKLLGHLDGVDTRMGAITRILRDGDELQLISSNSDHLRDKDAHLRFH
jgi:broad specificity phosphatase PhoE